MKTEIGEENNGQTVIWTDGEQEYFATEINGAIILHEPGQYNQIIMYVHELREIVEAFEQHRREKGGKKQ